MNYINVINRFISAMLLLLGCWMTSNLAWALESDSSKPIYIESNSATYDDTKGVSIYLGDVEVNQGSMRMTSNELIIYLKEGQINKLVANGTPARFKQKPEAGKEDIKGKALRVEYYPNKAKLLLIKKAVVWQGENTYASELIEYDNKNAIVKAGEESTDSKRVHVVLQPKQDKATDDKPAVDKKTAEQEKTECNREGEVANGAEQKCPYNNTNDKDKTVKDDQTSSETPSEEVQ